MSFQKNIKLLNWFNFFTDLKFYSPIAIIYFSKVSHSYALGASVFSITMIIAAVLDVPTGIYSDIIGRRKTIILGAVFSFLAVIFYALGFGYIALVIGGVFEGVSRAFYSGNNAALLHNMLSEEGLEDEYHTYSGKLSGMFQIALSVSGAVGGFLAAYSFALLMWLSVIPQALCVYIASQIVDQKILSEKTHSLSHHMKEAISSFMKNTDLKLLSAASVLGYAIGESGYQFQAAFWGSLWPVWAVGIAKTLTNVFAAVSFFSAGKIIKKFGALKVLLFGDIYATIINILSLAFPSIISPAIMATPSLLYGNGVTAEGTLLQEEFTDAQRATMSSLNSFMGSFVFAIFIFATGLFADKLSPGKSLLIFQSMYVVVIFLQWQLFKRRKKQSATAK